MICLRVVQASCGVYVWSVLSYQQTLQLFCTCEWHKTCAVTFCRAVLCRGFTSQLPEGFPVALSVLQEATGAVLLPWLSTQPVLDEDTCEVSTQISNQP